MDKYLVSLAFLLLFLEGLWLTHDLNPRLFNFQKTIKEGEPLGKVIKLKSQVRKKSQDSLIWEDTSQQDPLYAYDSVLTLSQSSTELELHGQSQITLNENTLVVIEPPLGGKRDGPLRLRFKKGRITTKTGDYPQTLEASDYVIEAAPHTKINLRSLTENNAEKTVVEAIQGKVKVSHGQNITDQQTIEAGSSLEISKQKLERKVAAVELKWTQPNDNSRYYTHSNEALVSFMWEGPATQIEINNQMQELPAGLTTYSLKLNLGTYSTKLLNGNSSTQTRVLNIWPAPKIYSISPVARQRFKKQESISFLWMQTAGAQKYVLQISKNQNFETIEKSVSSTDLGAAVDNLPSGHWYWRVRGIDDSGFEIPELYQSEFYILDKPLEPPKLKKPSIKRGAHLERNLLKEIFNLLIPQASADNVVAEFQWEKLEGAIGYVIEISQDPDFRNPLVSQRVQREGFKWNNFKLGNYYWRVAGVDESDQIGLFSESTKVDLTQTPTAPITQGTYKPAPKNPQPPKPEEPALFTLPKLDFSKPWHTAIELGGHGTFQKFWGGDYSAQDMGFIPYDFKISTQPPPSPEHKWLAEFELHLATLKIRQPGNYPFQDPITAFSFRFTLFDNEKFGIGVNQYLGFKRADLEALSFQHYLAVGPVVQWKRHRLGAYIGQAYMLDYSYLYRVEKEWTDTRNWTYGAEGRASGGMTLNKNLFYELNLFLWLGVQWK